MVGVVRTRQVRFKWRSVDGLSEAERREVFDLAHDANAADREHWVGLSPLTHFKEQAAELRARERLLCREIDREGVPG